MEAAERHPSTERFRAMGSDVVSVFDGPDTLSGRAESRLNQLERAWSRFIEDSEVSRLNSTSTWQRVGPDTILLFERATSAWEVTGGAFDPTVLSALVANGYRESRSEQQGHTVLSAAPSSGPAPGMHRIHIDAEVGAIRVPADVGFDPGGIGKGLAADIVAEGLVASGARAAMVAVGGDVRIAGTAPADWTVEVENPFDRGDTIATLSMRTGAVCTSSVHAKSWNNDGQPTHHIINPATGRSTSSSAVSATVVAAEAWMAEALCKAAIVTEPVDAIAFCRSLGVEAIVVDVEGIMWTTDKISRFAA